MAQTPPPHMPTDLTPAGVRAADDHLALEEVNGTEAMAFVAGENQRSLAALTGDPRYEAFRQQAEAILTATDRIPTPSFLGDGIGNFWQDAANPKGVWRRTTLDSYRSAAPRWETMLDIDALSKAEGKDWVWKGADCLAPDETRCLVTLSDGGKDAVVVREFDTTTGLWVEDGFILPEGKHRIEWLDRDTLLVATDFGPGTLTESRLSLHRQVAEARPDAGAGDRSLSRRHRRRRLWRQPERLSRQGRRRAGGADQPAAGHLPQRDLAADRRHADAASYSRSGSPSTAS